LLSSVVIPPLILLLNAAQSTTSKDRVSINYDKTSSRFIEISEALWHVYLTTDSTQGFLTSPSLRALYRVLDPQFPKLPVTFFSDGLDHRFRLMKADVCVSVIRVELADLPQLTSALHNTTVSVTYDGWTSDKTLGMVGVTAHFIHNYQLCKRILGVERLDRDHNAEAYCKAITSIWNSVGLDKSKVFGSTADNITLNDKLARLLDIHRFRCWAHRLSLPLTHLVWPDDKSPTLISELISKCRALATFTKQSSKASDDLEAAQLNNGNVRCYVPL